MSPSFGFLAFILSNSFRSFISFSRIESGFLYCVSKVVLRRSKFHFCRQMTGTPYSAWYSGASYPECRISCSTSSLWSLWLFLAYRDPLQGCTSPGGRGCSELSIGRILGCPCAGISADLEGMRTALLVLARMGSSELLGLSSPSLISYSHLLSLKVLGFFILRLRISWVLISYSSTTSLPSP